MLRAVQAVRPRGLKFPALPAWGGLPDKFGGAGSAREESSSRSTIPALAAWKCSSRLASWRRTRPKALQERRSRAASPDNPVVPEWSRFAPRAEGSRRPARRILPERNWPRASISRNPQALRTHRHLWTSRSRWREVLPDRGDSRPSGTPGRAPDDGRCRPKPHTLRGSM